MARCGCAGSSNALEQGSGISVTGTGTPNDPYIISYTGSQPDLTGVVRYDGNQGLSHADMQQALKNVGAGATVTPEQFGAVGDGVANDRNAIQNAIDNIAAAGGGSLVLSPHAIYGWKGLITVKNAVHIIGSCTRQPPVDTAPPAIPGLLALDNTAQLLIGDWTTASTPGGVQNLYVDGNKVGAGATALTGLVRMSGVDLMIYNLFVFRAAGDGIVVNGVQNSTVIGGSSTFHGGAALVMDNGPGAVSFQGGYYGTSHGGALACRDTPGQGNLYPFGPTQNTWDGTIFESYNTNNTPHTYHVHISGLANKFTNCNFTGGAVNSAACSVLVDSTISGIPSQVTFDNCFWWTFTNYDAIRATGSSRVHIDGYQIVADDGTHHALSFICADGGFPVITGSGYINMAGTDDGTRTFRAINSGSFIGAFHTMDVGINHRLRSNQVVGFRHEGDTGNRAYIDRDGALVWFDGAGGAPLGFIQKGSSGHGVDVVSDATGKITLTGAETVIGAGVSLTGSITHNQPTIVFASGAETADAAAKHTYRYAWTAATTTTFTFSNPVAGREVTLMLYAAAVPTITWPTNVRFAGNAAPTLVAGTMTSVTFRYDSDYTKWFETSRSVAVPLT